MFAGYRDEELIGEGGLGQLYRCVRESTGGIVAIKELRDVESGSPVWHRARRELDALLRLKGHPYVISVEEIIEGPHGPCLVMEYAPGGSLMDRLKRGPLTVPELVLTGQHVTQALAAAHEQGIVHRDVKPHNLLVASFGQVKVCDFGIAALTRGADGRTQTQALTLAYASPEELDGEGEVGPAADVYSFGATALHLLTGVRPKFSDRLGTGQTAPVLQLETDEPALRPIGAVLRSALAHSPDDRPSMQHLVDVFDEAAVALGSRRLSRLPLTPVAAEPAPVVAAAEPEVVDEEPEFVDEVEAPTVVRVATFAASTTAPAEPAPEPESAVPADDLTVVRGARPGASPAEPAEPDERPPAAPKRSRRTLVLMGAGLAVVAAIGVGIAVAGGGDDGAAATTTVAAPSTTDAPAAATTVPATAPAPAPDAAELATAAEEYLAFADAANSEDAAIHDKYLGANGLYAADMSNYLEIRPLECAELRDAEWRSLDAAKSVHVPESVVAVWNEQQYSNADLINAYDTCAQWTGDQAGLVNQDAVINTYIARAIDAANATRAALGLPQL